MDIATDPLLNRYLDSRRRKPQTKREYQKRITKYCEFIGKTPTELIEEAEQDQINQPLMRHRNIEKHLYDFRTLLDSSNFSPTYVSDTMSNVKSFYRHYNVVLPEIANTTLEEEQNRVHTMEGLPSLTHIEMMTDIASLKYKALILLGISSGMGSSELRNLKVSDYLNAHEVTSLEEIDESKVPTWHIKRIKTGMPYYTFSSPESNHAINAYLNMKIKKYKELEAKLEDATDSIKQRIENQMRNNEVRPESYIFDANGHIMSDITLAMYLGRLNDSCGFGKVGKQRFFHPHTMRKMFSSIVVNKGMEITDSQWLIGHKIHKMVDIYTKPSIQRLKHEYFKVLPFLSIEDIETKTIESEEYKSLIEENKMLKATLEELKGRVDSIEERGNEVRGFHSNGLTSDEFKNISDANMTLAKQLVPKDAKNRSELIEEHYMRLMQETWDNLPLIKGHEKS